MAWEKQIKKRLEVFMGNGERFYPIWEDAVKEITYNTVSFEFPGLEGTLVKRRKVSGREFDIVFHFVTTEKEDHLVTSERFEKASKDSRHWHILHPYYGDIRCHPTKLKYDNSKHGITTITGKVLETILGVAPLTLHNYKKTLEIKVEKLGILNISTYVNNTPDLSSVEIGYINDQLTSYQTNYSKIITEEEDSKNFNNLLSDAKSSLAKYTSDTIFVMNKIQEVAQSPAKLSANIFDRVRYFSEEIEFTKQSLLGLQYIPYNLKRLYENTVSSLFSAIFLSTANIQSGQNATPNNGVVITSSQILDLIFRIGDIWEDYIQTLDVIQDINNVTGVSFVQDYDLLNELQDLYNDSMANMYRIALESKKEVVINIEEDSNPIILTHRFYGLDEADENLNFFIKTNSLSMREQLMIEKGREIIWYI